MIRDADIGILVEVTVIAILHALYEYSCQDAPFNDTQSESSIESHIVIDDVVVIHKERQAQHNMLAQGTVPVSLS
jgi:hypothetical protein